jgi:hypothetical protein
MFVKAALIFGVQKKATNFLLASTAHSPFLKNTFYRDDEVN